MQPVKKVTELSIEKDLLYHYGRIEYWREHSSDNRYGYDSLTKENIYLQTRLLYYTSHFPQTLNYKFDSLWGPFKWDIKVVTSEDSLFRIYSWDKQTGGTMHFYGSMAQYRWGNKVSSVIWDSAVYKSDTGGPGPQFDSIYTYRANKKVYYIVRSLYILSSGLSSDGIEISTITKGHLKPEDIIKTDSGFTSALYSESDYTTGSKVQVPPLYYDAKTHTIHTPQMTNDTVFSGRFLTYKFTGKYFEVVKTP